MVRINVYSASGQLGWYDPDQTIEAVDETTRFDGRNHIGLITGDQHEHERLYLTKGGRWVLHHWSNWQGRAETHTFVTDEQAQDWLLRNGSDDVIARQFGQVDDERGPGRPGIGKPFPVRLPDNLREWVDQRAAERGVSRSAWIADLVQQARDTHTGQE